MKINKLKNIIKESYIKEIGDLKNIETYPYNKESMRNYSFDSNLGEVSVHFDTVTPFDFQRIKVKNTDFNPQEDEQYNISFDIGGTQSQFTKSNYSELVKIVATVKEIIDNFIKTYSPYSLLITGVDKKGEIKTDKQKNTLYLMIATKNIPQGYRLSEAVAFEVEGYILFKES